MIVAPMEEQNELERQIDQLKVKIEEVKQQLRSVELVPWRNYQWISDRQKEVVHHVPIYQSSH